MKNNTDRLCKFQVDGLLFVAGQIPLVPGSMVLLEDSLSQQVILSIRHVQRILQAMAAEIENIMQLTVFVAAQDDLEPAVEATKQLITRKDAIVSGVCVTTLPRFAKVEVLAVACEEVPILQSGK